MALLAIMFLCIFVALAYNLPPIHDRFSWRIANLQAQIRRAINPPERVVFVPQGQSNPNPVVTLAQATVQVLWTTSTPSQVPQATRIPPGATDLPPASPTPTLSPTAIPAKVVLSGILHEYQQFNNCGPANLAMALSYWGWQGDQRDTRLFLRPNKDVDDKNVDPSEMVAFVESQTELKALYRVGGDLETLKRLIAAGFPVLIEKGHHPPDDWWMGHYLVVNGYDDERARFITQDSLIMPDLPLPYEEMESRWWRDFNYAYLVIYPPERQAEVLAILGPQSDVTYNYQYAAQKARDEIPRLAGRDLFFAWYNLGSSLVGLQDYPNAAQAYDEAFEIYATLSEAERPYRVLWYQVGPYPAYYHAGRYQDVIDLANTTLVWVSAPVLEETFYWRGLARQALGDQPGAIEDLTKAAQLNPNFLPPRHELQRLGVPLP